MRRWSHEEPVKYFSEVRERAVRLIGERRASHPSEWAAIESIAAKIGCSAGTLHAWVRRHETDTGQRPCVTTAEMLRGKELERENKELRRANEILKLASAFLPRRSSTADSSHVGLRRRTSCVLRGRAALPGAADRPVGYRRHAARQRDPALRCVRARRDESLVPHIKRVWQVNLQAYGADKVWKQMNRKGIEVARCTVERLMRRLGLRGVGNLPCTPIPCT